MLVSEADGGGSFSEHGLLDLVLVAEEMGKLGPGPLVPVNVVARAARTPARRSRRRRCSRPAQWRGGGGLDRADAGRGRGAGDEIVLSGIAAAGGGGRPGAPPRGRPRRRRAHPRPRAGRRGRAHGDAPRGARPRAALRRARFEASASRSAVVGDVEGAELVERLLQIANVLQCAESCGAIDRVFEMTVEYLGDRYSFDGRCRRTRR